jgi:cell division protein ZapA (FtsZ GTPase activity inhibitor)
MDAADSSLRTTRVVIGQDRFQIQTDLSETELDEIVAFVSKKIEQHTDPGSRLDVRKQMILMAMDISSELFELRRRVTRAQIYYRESQKMADVLAELLENGINRVSSKTE